MINESILAEEARIVELQSWMAKDLLIPAHEAAIKWMKQDLALVQGFGVEALRLSKSIKKVEYSLNKGFGVKTELESQLRLLRAKFSELIG